MSKKYIPLAKILYTQDLTFNYLCENSKLLMSLYHISRHNSSVFFISNTTYFLKRKPIKVQFFRLSAAWIKVYQIPHIIFQTRSKFFFKVWIYFQCHEGSFFCTFLAETLYTFDKSSTSKYKFSDLPLLTLNSPNSSCHFCSKSQFFFKLYITLQCHETRLCTFSCKNLYAFDERNPSKCKFPDFQLLT